MLLPVTRYMNARGYKEEKLVLLPQYVYTPYPPPRVGRNPVKGLE